MPISKPVIAAALAAAVLFAFAQTAFGALFIFAAAVPLIMVGILKGREATFTTAALAGLFLSPFGMDALLVYAAIAAVPSALWMAVTTDTHRSSSAALTEIVLFAAVATAALHLAMLPLGGLGEVLLSYLEPSFATADPNAYRVLTRFPFLPIASAAWWFVLMFYLHARIARFLLRQASADLPLPDFQLTPYFPSPWLLSLLPVLACAGFIEGDHKVIAEALFLIFLLPYAINGFISAHSKLKAVRGGALMLALLYVASIALVWPVLVMAGMGVWQHVQRLSTKKP